MTPPKNPRIALDPVELAANLSVCVADMSLVLPCVLARAPIWKNGAVCDLTANLEEAIALGLGCLSVRAVAAASCTQGDYMRLYKKLCSEVGIDVIDASVRRRLMYFPILSGDDTLEDVIIEQRRYNRGSKYFSVVKTTNLLKGMFKLGEYIDWQPWGGRPNWDT